MPVAVNPDGRGDVEHAEKVGFRGLCGQSSFVHIARFPDPDDRHDRSP